MNKNITLLNPVETITLSQGPIEVRQLPFLKALKFLEKLGANASEFFDEKGQLKLAQQKEIAPGQYALHVDLSVLEKIIASSSELMEFLVVNCTGKDHAWAESLTLTEGMAVLSAAIRQNLSKEVLEMGNGLAVFLGETLMGKTASLKQ